MPPFRRDEFWKNDGDEVIRALDIDFFEVVEERLHERAERRLQYDERYTLSPLFPIAPKVLGRDRIDIHIDSADLGGECRRILDRLHDRAVDPTDGHQDGVMPARRLLPFLQ